MAPPGTHCWWIEPQIAKVGQFDSTFSMPRWHCAECVRHFSSTHNFLQHINGRRNIKCKLHYERELPARQPGAYDMGNIEEKRAAPPSNIPPPSPPHVARLPTERDKVPVRGKPKDDFSVSDEAMGGGGLDKFANDEHNVESNADNSDGEPMDDGGDTTDEGGDAMDEGYPTEDEAADKTTFREKFREYVAHDKNNFQGPPAIICCCYPANASFEQGRSIPYPL